MYSKNASNFRKSGGGMQIRSDHIVPVDIRKVISTKEDSVTVGSSKFVRVITMGKMKTKIIDDNLNTFRLELLEEEGKGDSKLIVEKVFSPTFPRRSAEQLNFNDIICVYGKIRLDDDGNSFLNAFSLRKVCLEEFKTFKLEIKLTEDYYLKNSAYMPSESDSSNDLNLGTLGLSRFPMAMLEHSNVVQAGGNAQHRVETKREQTPDSFDAFVAKDNV